MTRLITMTVNDGYNYSLIADSTLRIFSHLFKKSNTKTFVSNLPKRPEYIKLLHKLKRIMILVLYFICVLYHWLGPPNKPNYMSVINSSKASLTFQWTPTSSGDEIYDYQTFVIQYKICTTVDWLSQNFVVTGATNDPQTANISDLTAGSLYDIRMTASNTIGSSSYTDIIVVSTLSENVAEAAGLFNNCFS